MKMETKWCDRCGEGITQRSSASRVRFTFPHCGPTDNEREFDLCAGCTQDVRDELLAGRKTARRKIVCLCGSTRFMEAFFEAGWEETLKGHVVLSVGVCKHAEHHGAEALGGDVADQLDELHLRKIDLADEVRILNVGGYIGDSTRKELEYARRHRKQITFLEPEGMAKA
jgi:hypothetical protein